MASSPSPNSKEREKVFLHNGSGELVEFYLDLLHPPNIEKNESNQYINLPLTFSEHFYDLTEGTEGNEVITLSERYSTTSLRDLSRWMTSHSQEKEDLTLFEECDPILFSDEYATFLKSECDLYFAELFDSDLPRFIKLKELSIDILMLKLNTLLTNIFVWKLRDKYTDREKMISLFQRPEFLTEEFAMSIPSYYSLKKQEEASKNILADLP